MVRRLFGTAHKMPFSRISLSDRLSNRLAGFGSLRKPLQSIAYNDPALKITIFSRAQESEEMY